DPDATARTEAAPAVADTAAALERLFGEYHFPAGSRRILLAAATAFAERGFHATTTRDIAAQAGLSPPRCTSTSAPRKRCCTRSPRRLSTSPSRSPRPRRAAPARRQTGSRAWS